MYGSLDNWGRGSNGIVGEEKVYPSDGEGRKKAESKKTRESIENELAKRHHTLKESQTRSFLP